MITVGGSGNRMHQDIPKQFNINKLQYIIHGAGTNYLPIRNEGFELSKHFSSDDIVHDS